MSTVTRFAPSPTGLMHLGHAFSAYCGWRRARESGGIWRLRLEDIDQTRCTPQYAAAILEDLQWLGLHWDGDVRVQSAHLPDYLSRLEQLYGMGLTYPCFCTRAEIARAQAAPHVMEPNYVGTCRHLPLAAREAKLQAGLPFAVRLNCGAAMRVTGPMTFYEEGFGWLEAMPGQLGDVVLARKDTPSSYHLCVVSDDALQEVTHVVRGEDLRQATHVQVLLQKLLGVPTPVYAHHPLLRDGGGKRLAKRDHAATLRGIRQSGVAASRIIERLQPRYAGTLLPGDFLPA